MTNQLKQKTSSILQKLAQLQSLHQRYSHHVDKHYLQTINEIMTKFTESCQIADLKYQNIEKEIDDNTRIIYLLSQIHYYNQQDKKMQQILHKKKSQLQQLKSNNLFLQNHKHNLQKQLYSKSKQILKSKFRFYKKCNKVKEQLQKSINSSCNKSLPIENSFPSIPKINFTKKLSSDSTTKPHTTVYQTQFIASPYKIKGNFFSNQPKIIIKPNLNNPSQQFRETDKIRSTIFEGKLKNKNKLNNTSFIGFY